jgi:(2R)-sulfolactate sulfo-lyase subunit alpha
MAAIVTPEDLVIQVIYITCLTPGLIADTLAPLQFPFTRGAGTMIHFVLHDAKDTVAVVVVEGVKAGMALNGWIMDDDKMTSVEARQDIPIGHKVALKDMQPGDTVLKYGIDIGKVVAPIKAGEHAHVQNIKTKRW